MSDPSLPRSASRRDFLRQFAAAAGWFFLTRRLAAQPSPQTGGQSGFARLVTPGPFWATHQDQDAAVARFIAEQAHVAFAPTACAVNPSDLDALCAFPLVFTNDLAPVIDPRDRANLAEYVRRGGFIYVDGCVDWKVTPSFQAFFRRQREFFASVFPGSRLQMLPEDHPIFRSYFRLHEADIRNGRASAGHWGDITEALYAVFDDRRMIALLSLDHLRCGWPNDPEKRTSCLKQITNIYVYVMTR